MTLTFSLALAAQLAFLNKNRPVLDAHNCYPYEGQWTDRIERALSTGFPVGIEQDLAWYVDPVTGQGRIVISHSPKTDGTEPTLQHYFFDRVRPIVEKELREGDRSHWPVIVLHFDFKDNQAPLLQAVWNLLGEYEHQGWITTAAKTQNPGDLQPFDPKPLLVLTEDSDAQENVFFNAVPITGRLRLFGSAHTRPVNAQTQAERNHLLATLPPEQLLAEMPTNYRRWWNNSWYLVEEGGAPGAGEWTQAKANRLRALVDYAHNRGFWIRFYTLDGFAPANDKGWGTAYNFGLPERAQVRWKAAIEAGVNLIATDQYEDLGKLMRQKQ
ncbi:MAG: hypothetical protein JO185_04460 [Acidobacteriaceae bacterium]|nr:hypothetical protein [Acidobacteriaceae bacterium]